MKGPDQLQPLLNESFFENLKGGKNGKFSTFCEKHNIKVMFTWLDEGNRQDVNNAQPEWMYNHLTDHVKGSIDLPGIRQAVIEYEKVTSDVWCENDYQGHPNELGHKMYFEEHIKPRLADV